jgi:carboxypeptidase PM20D1
VLTRRLILGLLLFAISALLSALALNTLRQHSRQIKTPAIARIDLDEQAAAVRLAGAVRLRTVSEEAPSPQSNPEFLRLHGYLVQSFPSAHRVLSKEIVGGYSLLYTWVGQNPAEQPILLMAHQDVVPIAPGTESEWHADPFGGEIRDGFVWGRGAWDDKGNLMAILEAVDALAAAGFKPRRTIYLAFGHDEENGGANGAAAIARLLIGRGVHCEYALDEGLLISEGIMPGLAAPLALIGVAEKGSLSLRISASAIPGHSSMPPAVSAIGTLARALEHIEAAPMPAAIGGVAGELFDTVAPELRSLSRVVMSNRWLFGPLIRAQLERQPATNAMLRTTAAITIINGGNKENVLPGHAEALVNFRLVPGETSAGVIAHVARAINDRQVRIEVATPVNEAPAVASRVSPAYRGISRTIRALFPDAVVAPGLMIGATDSRHMARVADDIYRFSPVRARADDLPRFHGTDERMAISNYGDLIRFYELLIRDSAGQQ